MLGADAYVIPPAKHQRALAGLAELADPRAHVTVEQADSLTGLLVHLSPFAQDPTIMYQLHAPAGRVITKGRDGIGQTSAGTRNNSTEMVWPEATAAPAQSALYSTAAHKLRYSTAARKPQPARFNFTLHKSK